MIIAIVILLIVIITSGIYFYQSQEQQIKDSVSDDLSYVATLKANQITAWRQERLFDERGISSETYFIKIVDHYLTYGDNESREIILSRFRGMNLTQYYYNILLVDLQGNVRLSLDPSVTSIPPIIKTQVNESLKSGDPVLTDFYRMPGSHPIQMDVISPLLINTDGSEKAVGAVLLSIDPNDFLYPLVQSSPVLSKSAETVLVEREGDHVLYLNELKYQDNTALNLTIPLSRTDLPAVMAVLGTTGTFIGKDYRGVDVISAMEPVPGSPWFIVVKIDTEEAFSGWFNRSPLIIALIAGSIISALFIVGLLWQRTEKNYFHSQYLAEAERSRAEAELAVAQQLYRNVVEDQTELICRYLPNGTHIFVNDAYCRYFDKKREEIIGHRFKPVIHPDDREIIARHLASLTPLNPVKDIDQRIIMHDGSIRWQRWSDRAIFDENKKIIEYQSVGRDISDLKRAEDALRQVNNKLNLLSSITRHDIGNQVMALNAYIALTEDAIENPVELKEYIAKEKNIADAMASQIAFTKDYEDLGVKSPVWHKVNARVRDAGAAHPMRNIFLEAQCPGLEIFADPLLEKVFFNLIDNSLRYGGEKMTAIRVTASKSGEAFRIIYEDDGNGISADDKKQLFRKGYGKHTGLGLFLSREILSLTGITITENGEPGKGSRFEITVPRVGYRFENR
jgi:PAS domain S-box-containing protein